MQYTVAQLQKIRVRDFKVIGFDIKPTDLKMPGVYTFQQDVTDIPAIDAIFTQLKIGEKSVDFIQSDMAPNTIGDKDIDAMRSIGLLEETLWIYEKYLKPEGKFATKIFMGPWFDEYIANMKKLFGGKNIKIFKPQSSRKESKETYVIKI